MKKLVLSAAAVMVASLFAAPSFANEVDQECGGLSAKASCKLHLKAKVKPECGCYFDEKKINFGLLKHNKVSEGYSDFYVKCNTEKANVTLKSKNGGLAGGNGDPVLWELWYNGVQRYTSDQGEVTLDKVDTSKSPFNLHFKTQPYDFYNVSPGAKHDMLIVHVSPAIY